MTADFGNFVAKNDEKQKTKDEMNLAYVCRKIIWFICLRIWQNASVLSWKKLPLAICFNPLRTDRCQQIKQNWIWRRSSSELKNWSSGPVEKLVARQAAAGHIELRVSQFVHSMTISTPFSCVFYLLSTFKCGQKFGIILENKVI